MGKFIGSKASVKKKKKTKRGLFNLNKIEDPPEMI